MGSIEVRDPPGAGLVRIASSPARPRVGARGAIRHPGISEPRGVSARTRQVPRRTPCRRIPHAALALAASVALVACADDGPEPAASSALVETVTIERSRFDTAELRIEAGTTVEFVNLDPFAHTVTSHPESPLDFDSGTMGDGDAFAVTFDEPGEYPFFCEIHPTMRGVVIVS